MNLSIPLISWAIILLILGTGLLSYFSGKLTFGASVTGIAIAILIYAGAGLAGLILLATFFLLGTLSTEHKKEYKVASKLTQLSETRRTAGQVFANAGVAAVCSALILLFNNREVVLQILLASSFASATGDTVSSELGNVYGKRYFNVLNFKPDQRGLNGVISLEGTLFGMAGSATVATIHCIFFGWTMLFFVVLFAGVAGNLFDSILGAMFERKGQITNNVVNFLNTLFAALVAWLFIWLT